jgi:saccharopine dehydrogenase-like NADP-dependent oxidoreductase
MFYPPTAISPTETILIVDSGNVAVTVRQETGTSGQTQIYIDDRRQAMQNEIAERVARFDACLRDIMDSRFPLYDIPLLQEAKKLDVPVAVIHLRDPHYAVAPHNPSGKLVAPRRAASAPRRPGYRNRRGC